MLFEVVPKQADQQRPDTVEKRPAEKQLLLLGAYLRGMQLGVLIGRCRIGITVLIGMYVRERIIGRKERGRRTWRRRVSSNVPSESRRIAEVGSAPGAFQYR